MITIQQVELGVLGPLQVRQFGLPVSIPGAKPRAVLTLLGLYGGSVVAADTLVELLWGDDPPRTAAKALQTHISALRRALGDGFVLTQGTGWTVNTAEIDAARYRTAATLGRSAMGTGDASEAVVRFDEALTLWRGAPELPEGRRGRSEKTRWVEDHAALVEDRADALLATGRAAEIIGELEAAIADAPLRERRWGQLMLALYRAGRQGEALAGYQRVRSLLADELGVDPGPDLRRLEAAIVAQNTALELPVSHQHSVVMRAVTFLLTDIEGSTAAWERDADAMAAALARHDEMIGQVVTSRGGRLIKTRGEGDATFSVFDRPSAAAAAAIELQEAVGREPWSLVDPLRVRVALHSGEVEFRDGDYFGRAVNRAARLRSLAAGGQTLCSGATAELVIDSLADDVVLADLGTRQLKNLARPERVFELRLERATDTRAVTVDPPFERPVLPAVLTGPGPFVGRDGELARLLTAWQTTLSAGAGATLIAGEPGVGKTRLAGEWSRQAFEQGAVVLYGRCDEDLGAPYQPFAEAMRSLVPCLGTHRLRGLRGVEALLPLVPGLADVVPDLEPPPRADADTERYALFDAVVGLLGVASASAPVVLILDDLHWASKPTLLLLRHILRFGEHARVQIIGTYRSTDLDRSHPLAAMLADLNRDGSADRLQLAGLDQDDVTTYVAASGYDDEELAHALASVTGGNPFFLIEALRHVDESGGRWDPSTLPQGVREAVSRRLSRLPAETNKALAAAAVVGSRFAVDLVEQVVEQDLVDAFDEASKAGILIEEPGGRYRFNHALVRQSLLAELASVRRMRLHQRIAAALEAESSADDELLAELAYHYFECAWAGNAAKAVDYCRRAADQAMARLAYEGAADLYDKALHALAELDEDLPDRDEQHGELLIARCEALLAAGDVASATGAVDQLRLAAGDSGRIAAWGACFDGQLSVLTHPERLDEIEVAVGAAAATLADLGDAAGEAKAHTVRAGCLGRLGRIGDSETALDRALTAARRAREHRRVNAVLANAPLAALWGPNPVPRAGGRCLDVVRLLRITTGSPVVEATSTRCQGVLDAFRGRAGAGRQLIESARRSLSELGMRHALLEVDQFAGIIELVADEPSAAEGHLRRAYTGFRRMGLDADTAETAALLARACLALGRDAAADELCLESEGLAGHALKASISWRTVRAQLLARSGDHGEARRVAEEAVAIAERTDALVDHGDACLALAVVLGIAGDTAGARGDAERAAELYELKGAVALAEKARGLLGAPAAVALPAEQELESIALDNACARAIRRLEVALDRGDWAEIGRQLAASVLVENRQLIVHFPRHAVSSEAWVREARRLREFGAGRHRYTMLAMRGERAGLARLATSTDDTSPGAPQIEMLQLFGLDEDGRIELQVGFDVEDIDAALAELDTASTRLETQSSRTSLENAATRAGDRFGELFLDGRWDEIGALYADNIAVEDRRRGLSRESDSRATEVANISAVAELGIVKISPTPLALRGDRLSLSHVTFRGRDGFGSEVLAIVEVDPDEQIIATVSFDPDAIDAAFEELETRYLAGEAALYAATWSIAIENVTLFNNHEHAPWALHPLTADHRRVTAFAPGDQTEYLRATWEQTPDMRMYIEVVHRLNHVGTVVSYLARGTVQDGFEAEWRGISVEIFAEDSITRSERFDPTDLDAALARFDELSRPTARLENTATRADSSFNALFADRRWDGYGALLVDDIHIEDRRAGLCRVGDDAATELAELRAVADLGVERAVSEVIAVRGDRLALVRMTAQTAGDQAFEAELLRIVDVDGDGRIVAGFIFDSGDIDAAFDELDARYLAGEAAAHGHTWSVIVNARGVFNRDNPADVVNIDHRRVYVEVVHQLNESGAVVTGVCHGTSHDAFDAEWRHVQLLVVHGDALQRNEMFDEADLDAALARFDEISRPVRRVENAASRVYERFYDDFARGDWNDMGELVADDASHDDRRRTVNGGIIHGRRAIVEAIRSLTDVRPTAITATVVATRGERLLLSRAKATLVYEQSDGFVVEFLDVVEIDADERVIARVMIDLEDSEAAFAELDSRYLAGDGASHVHTWSVLAEAFSALNRLELPAMTRDCVTVDHRRAVSFASGELCAFISAERTLDTIHTHIEAVHRLSDRGAVLTYVSVGTSHEGFDAEWRSISLSMVRGNLVNRCEIFDESDLDAAVDRFDELSRLAPELENAASRVDERFLKYFAAHEWDSMAAMMTDEIVVDDRRRVVNAGIRRGRDATIADARAIAYLGASDVASTLVAIRGERLALVRNRFIGSDQAPEAFRAEMLSIIEIEDSEREVVRISFDLDDFEAAFAELDDRYLAGEAATHASTWSLITRSYAGMTRGELPPTAPNLKNVDHRRAANMSSDKGIAYLHASWDLASKFTLHIEAVHRLTESGAVFTRSSTGTSQQGFEAEWRAVDVVMIDGGLITQGEIFDEADLDAALARFDELARPSPRLENAASRSYERFWSYFDEREWDRAAALIADDACSDDRRRVVGAGLRRGRESAIADLRVLPDVGFRHVTNTVLANRGSRLALVRCYMESQATDAFHVDALHIVEVGADGRFTALVVFDSGDLTAAIDELDSRYLASEAAAHAHTWAVIAGATTAFNRHEPTPTTPQCVVIDHRLRTTIAAEEADKLPAYLKASWDLTPDLQAYIETVHVLGSRGAVVTTVTAGTTPEGFHAEWRQVTLMTISGELGDRCEIFDEPELDIALATFDELSQPVSRLENAASRAVERFEARFLARDWDAVADMVSADNRSDDRRRVVGAGIGLGRDAALEDLRGVAAQFAHMKMESVVVATRGDRLTLCRGHFSGRGEDSDALQWEFLEIIEIDDDDRILASVTFETNELDTATAELDARYLAGEAAPYEHAWSVITRNFAAFNRREFPQTSPDWVAMDHRRMASVAAEDIPEYIRSVWDDLADFTIRIETVHRLSELGAVVTEAMKGTSPTGFDAEWREVQLLMIEGDVVTRSELFDESDLDAALARFDDLSRPTPRLENAASQVTEIARMMFAARDWDGIREHLAEEFSLDDRRHTVDGGASAGRDSTVDDLRAAADVGFTHVVEDVVACRGERLVLTRARYSDREPRPEAFFAAVLHVLEIDADRKIVATVVFDQDDLDAALAELDARYLAGEAAAHAHIWSAVAQTYAAFNRHELSKTTPDWVNIDHRMGVGSAPGDMNTYVSAMWELVPDVSTRIVAVHRLSDLGAVFTHTESGTSADGFAAEWLEVALLTFDGDAINRCELFDETNLDAALARFDELDRPRPLLENAASQAAERFARFATGDVDALAETFASDFIQDDRRRVVGAGVRHGRGAEVEDLRAFTDVGLTNVTLSLLATRGEHLVLSRASVWGGDSRSDVVHTDMLTITEVDTDGRITALVILDLDDIDAAFAELDARYLAGEAAACAGAWSVVAGAYAAMNRHELPNWTAEFESVDHRKGIAVPPGELKEYVRATWADTPGVRVYVETVHRLSDVGVLVTHVTKGRSEHDFEAEWRIITLSVLEGNLIARSEMFDEDDLDAALARFDELSRSVPRLENAASRMYRRYNASFAVRDWAVMSEMVADDIETDDRRGVVSGGVERGRDAQMLSMRAAADVGVRHVASTVIATRGDRLALLCGRVSGDQRPDAFGLEMLTVVEVDGDNRFTAGVLFGFDHTAAAFAELDARYLAGEAAPYERSWSAVVTACAAVNCRQVPEHTPDCVSIDHRRAIGFAPGEMTAYMGATMDDIPEYSVCIERVHRLTQRGAIIGFTSSGTSHGGFDAEWRMLQILMVNGDLISHVEIYEEDDIDAALARFNELIQTTPPLENQASRTVLRFVRCFALSDWYALTEILAGDFVLDDRRRLVGAGVRHGRDAEIDDLRAFTDVGLTNAAFTVLATRGERLVLSRTSIGREDSRSDEAHTDMLAIADVDAAGRMVATVMFDLDDLDAAFAELDSRYLGGEATPHARTWSFVVEIYAAFNRHQLSKTTADWVNIDHRVGVGSALADMDAYVSSIWALVPDARARVEAVHRLSGLGAVVTSTSTGSANGFDAEWRMVHLFTVDGDLFNRCEIFDESDLDAALARFDELTQPAPRLENAACRAGERLGRAFVAGDWETVEHLLDQEFVNDDRRRVVNAGVRYGRDAGIADLRASAVVGFARMSWSIIATRGEHLALTRARYWRAEEHPEDFHNDLLHIAEINANGLIVSVTTFDTDDLDAGFDELDERYLAGEAAVHAHTWSAIAKANAVFNRGEMPPTTPDWANVDHRRGGTAFAPGDQDAYMRATWDVAPNISNRIVAVHRLGGLGAVFTQHVQATSGEGFNGEWWDVVVLILDGDMISQCEVFDEDEREAALAKFDELDQSASRLENAASRVGKRFRAAFASRDWDTMADTLSDDLYNDDRRRVVNAGVRHGRESMLDDMQTGAELGVPQLNATEIATRGERLVLVRAHTSYGDRPEDFRVDNLVIGEIDSSGRIYAQILFDPDDIDAALAELDERYLAGEAAAHGDAWQVITRGFDAINRGGIPLTAEDFVDVDHRSVAQIGPGDLKAYLAAGLADSTDNRLFVECVHRLSDLGGVVTHVATATSQTGLDVEWRMIDVLITDGALLARCELFNETDLDHALARFDELTRECAPDEENRA